MIRYEKYRLSRIITVQEIESADYVRGPHPSSYNHAHEDAWELCVCLEGQAAVIREQQQYLLQAGQIFFIQPGQTHDIGLPDQASAAFVVSFVCTNSDYMRPLQDSMFIADETLLDIFQKMIQELNATFARGAGNLHLFQFVPSADSPLGAEQMLCGYLEQVIISMLRNVTMDQNRIIRSGNFKDAIQAHLINQVTSYINDHLGERLTVEAIANHFHYSRARLSTIYKNYTGLGINEMITHKRIKQAKILLTEQKKTVAQISEELGFSSPQYFSHKFTEEVGVPPSKYTAASQKN